MASAAEQLAASINFSAFTKATELKSRIWFTLGALVIYRLGTYIPIPGIDPAILHDIFARNAGGILGMFDMFSGGALGRMTIFALGIMPYISASIIIQLLTAVSPTLEALKKEGESGRKKLNQYTRYGTVLLAAVQGYGIGVGIEGMHAGAETAVLNPGLGFPLVTVVTLIGGTVFLMWLGEQITARGVGNGISLIIFSGIVANLPHALASTLELGRTGRDLDLPDNLPYRDRRSAWSGLSCLWSAPSAAFWCSIQSAKSATRCSAAMPPICRSRSTPRA